jgi:nitrite reductase (NADH) large subunit
MRTSDPVIYAAGDVAEHDGTVHGLWPVAVAQAEIAAANAVGDERLYEPRPPVTILKGVGLSVTSSGDVDEQVGDDVVVREPSEDEVRYSKVLTRDGVLVGAVLIGDWRDGQSIVDAVAARAPASVEPVANVTVTGVAGSAAPPAPAAP